MVISGLKANFLRDASYKLSAIVAFFALVTGSVASLFLPGWTGASEKRELLLFLVFVYGLLYTSVHFFNPSTNKSRYLILFGPAVSVYFFHFNKSGFVFLSFIFIIFLGISVGRVFQLKSFVYYFPIGIATLQVVLHIISDLKYLNWLILLIIFLALFTLSFSTLKKIDLPSLNLPNSLLVLYSVLFWINSICAVAPDLLFDSLNSKAAVPLRWFLNGSISIDTYHPQLGLTGSMSYALLLSHLFGGGITGGVLQSLCLIYLFFVFLKGNTSPLSHLLLMLFMTMPAVIWQVSGSYDDVWISLICLSVFASLFSLFAELPNWRQLLGIGMIISNLYTAKFSLVLFLFVPFLALVFFLKFKKIWFVVIGFTLPVLIEMNFKYQQTSNPLWPQFNNVFKSQYLPFINLEWNLPYASGGLANFLMSPFKTIVTPTEWVEGSSPGLYGASLFLILVMVSIFVSNAYRNFSIRNILSLSIIPPVFFWYIEFRYLRYLFPIFVVGSYLISVQSEFKLPRFSRKEAILFLVSSISLIGYPSGIPMVPDRVPISFAYRQETEVSYLSRNLPNFELLNWLNSSAPQNSRIISYDTLLYERALLRTDLDYSFDWELPISRYADYNLIVTGLNRNNLDLINARFCLVKIFKQTLLYEKCVH